jgi:hypothetical protein
MEETTTLMKDVLGALEMISEETLTAGSLDELVRRLELMHRTAIRVKDLSDALTEQIGSRMESNETSLAGIGVVQRKVRTSSTWIDDLSKERMMDDAISAIVRRVATDPASGEIHAPLANVAREVWRLTQDAFSFGADPKTAFRKVLGLAPDEYRAKRATGYTISIIEGESNVAK